MNMKTVIFSTTALTLVGILGIGLQDVWSDDDDGMKMRSRGVAPVTDPLYKEECGSCHFAYPPGLLPAASWQRIMAGLDDHFGDNAELDTQAGKQLNDYLTTYAADASGYRRSRAIMRSLRYSRTPPLRITETPYFRHEHSTGPKTTEGKRRASISAYKGGIRPKIRTISKALRAQNNAMKELV